MDTTLDANTRYRRQELIDALGPPFMETNVEPTDANAQAVESVARRFAEIHEPSIHGRMRSMTWLCPGEVSVFNIAQALGDAFADAWYLVRICGDK